MYKDRLMFSYFQEFQWEDPKVFDVLKSVNHNTAQSDYSYHINYNGQRHIQPYWCSNTKI